MAQSDRTCVKCGKLFPYPRDLKKHLARKTPCEPILDHLPEEVLEDSHVCKYCGREFASKTSMYRHVRQSCKIANSEEGMDKLMEHTLQRQVTRMEEQLTKLTELLEKQQSALVAAGALVPTAGSSAMIVNSPMTRIERIGTQINIEKVEIRPWNDACAVTVDIASIAAAFAENARLKEYVRLPEHSLTDPAIAPPYVAELFTDLVKRGHADPAARNIYLNPRRADQVLVHLKDGAWAVKPAQEGMRALLDGVATSVHEVTLSSEKRKQLPLEAQNALATAGLLYEDEPETYVELAKAPLVAHLTNLVPKKQLPHS